MQPVTLRQTAKAIGQIDRPRVEVVALRASRKHPKNYDPDGDPD